MRFCFEVWTNDSPWIGVVWIFKTSGNQLSRNEEGFIVYNKLSLENLKTLLTKHSSGPGWQLLASEHKVTGTSNNIIIHHWELMTRQELWLGVWVNVHPLSWPACLFWCTEIGECRVRVPQSGPMTNQYWSLITNHRLYLKPSIYCIALFIHLYSYF